MKTVTTPWRTTCLVTLAAFLDLAAAVYTNRELPCHASEVIAKYARLVSSGGAAV